MYKFVATTLFEGHYEYGVGGLVNSLVISGFEGIFCVGYKGRLPFWINQLQAHGMEENCYQVSDKVCVRFDELTVDMHFGYYKPYYLNDMQKKYPGAKGYYYFDPDIVVLTKWNFFDDWIENGVALCQDNCFELLHWNDPWRNKWRLDFAQFDEGIDRTLNFYINSGFIGINKENFGIIQHWMNFTEMYKAHGYPIHFFDKKNALNAYKGDQDVLNAVLTLRTSEKISLLGKEAMGFAFPVTVMAHAVDGQGIKPWKRNYIRTALRGQKASVADEAYLKFCILPIRLYLNRELSTKKRMLKLSKVINRFCS